MKGVILAAGVSSRLRPLTDLVPKCLLELGGRSILGMTLANLVANGISDIVIVTGYREDQIRGFVRDTFPGLNVGFVRNDRFETTNNSYSLWLTSGPTTGSRPRCTRAPRTAPTTSCSTGALSVSSREPGTTTVSQ